MDSWVQGISVRGVVAGVASCRERCGVFSCSLAMACEDCG